MLLTGLSFHLWLSLLLLFFNFCFPQSTLEYFDRQEWNKPCVQVKFLLCL